MTLAVETERLWLESAPRKVHSYDPVFGGNTFTIDKPVGKDSGALGRPIGYIEP
jgi:hypothetical protein